jgi:hypothetical protein
VGPRDSTLIYYRACTSLERSLIAPRVGELGAHHESKNGCCATGKADGFILWARVAHSKGAEYSLRFQYVEALKTEMDPIVTHVRR